MSKQTKSVSKQLKYSVLTKIINFDPKKIGSKIIIVNGEPAIRIKDKVYIKIK